MNTKYQIEGVATDCRFCGAGKLRKNMPVFQVAGPAFAGTVCAMHLATLVEAAMDDQPNLLPEKGG